MGLPEAHLACQLRGRGSPPSNAAPVNGSNLPWAFHTAREGQVSTEHYSRLQDSSVRPALSAIDSQALRLVPRKKQSMLEPADLGPATPSPAPMNTVRAWGRPCPQDAHGLGDAGLWDHQTTSWSLSLVLSPALTKQSPFQTLCHHLISTAAPCGSPFYSSGRFLWPHSYYVQAAV